jgi:hypothetical protein
MRYSFVLFILVTRASPSLFSSLYFSHHSILNFCIVKEHSNILAGRILGHCICSRLTQKEVLQTFINKNINLLASLSELFLPFYQAVCQKELEGDTQKGITTRLSLLSSAKKQFNYILHSNGVGKNNYGHRATTQTVICKCAIIKAMSSGG